MGIQIPLKYSPRPQRAPGYWGGGKTLKTTNDSPAYYKYVEGTVTFVLKFTSHRTYFSR